MQIPLVKLKAILRYFCTNTEPDLLGKTKLMKLFYFADFGHVKKYAVPITYDRYFRLDRGPVPSTILNLVNEVADGEDAILADTIQIKKDSPSLLQKIECIKRFDGNDRKLFSTNEWLTLESVSKQFANRSAREMVQLAHAQAPWLETKELDEIHYTLAAHDNDCLVDEEDIQLLSQL